MKKKFTKIISAVLAAACVAAPLQSASAALLGLGKAGRTTTPLEGATDTTPPEYKFGFGGKEFIILDSEVKEGKTYFFILTEEHYGKHNFNEAENVGCWDLDTPTNIAHWLNNEFLQNGNGGNYKLPDEIKTYIDYEHEWNTEPIPNLVGTKYETELVTTSGIALISNYEWKKYVAKMGANVDPTKTHGWLFRTNRSDVGATNAPMYTGGGAPAGTTNAWSAKAGTLLYVRPCFYLSEDFFANNKVTSAGDSVVVDIDKFSNPALYTDAEKQSIFRVTANNVYITGDPIVGDTLTANYTYTSVFEEGTTEFEWYVSDTENGDYTKISGANGKTFMPTTAQQGKYIKVKVIPGSKSRVNPKGNGVMSDSAVGFIYGEAQINSAVGAVNSADSNEVFTQLSNANVVFKLDLALSDVSDKNNVAVIFSKMDSDSVQSVRDNYNAAVTIQKLNEESDETEISVIVLEDKLMTDISRYKELSDKSSVIDSVKGKNFNDYNTFYETFTQQTALADFKQTDRSEIKTVMLAQDKYLTADISSLSDYRLGLASTSVLSAAYSTFAELDSAVTAAVNAAKAVEDVKNAADASNVNKTGYPSGFAGTTAPSIAYRQNNVPSIESDDDEEETAVFADLSLVPWAQESITALYKRGILSGDGDGMFRPNDTLKREEFVTMIANTFFADYKAENIAPFADVDSTAWYAQYVNAVYEKGAAAGMSDEIFGIGNEITREDMAVILYRLISDKSNAGTKTFTDSGKISDYAKEAVEFMAANGIINGMDDGSFNPKGAATRAMAAKVIHGVLEFIEG